MANEVIVYQYPNADFSGSNFGKLAKDPVLQVLGDAGLLLWDLGSDLGWPAQIDPTNGDTILNLSAAPDAVTNGSVVMAGGITYAGGGFDFSGTTANGNYFGFGSAAAEIYANGEDFLCCIWVKLPTSADWANTTGVPFLTFGNFVTGAAFLDFYMVDPSGTAKNLAVRRQKNTATSESIAFTSLNASTLGSVVQWACWRKGDVFNARLRSAVETKTGTPVSGGGANALDFSSCTMKVGVSNDWGWSSTLSANQLNANNHRHYRGYLADISSYSGSITDLLDMDYENTVARSVYT